MAIDDTKVQFSSEWDIQRIRIANTKTVTVPAFGGAPVQLENLSSYNLTKPPKYFASYSIDGGLTWHQPGSNPGTGGVQFGPYLLTTPTSVSVASDHGSSYAATIKYWIFTSDAIA